MPIEATKYAIQYVEEEVVQAKEKKPFFMHYALHAPHWPLQALREDVEIYLDALKDGTDAVRQRRYDHMIQQGIFDRETCLLEPANEAWDDLSPERQAYYRRALAVHYAMVHRMDIELGKFFDYLKEKGLWENTLIFFCSDNGASGEGDTTVIPEGGLLGDRGTQARIDSIGAQMCNTPFRGNKSTLHEGGNCTPMIVHWPAAIGKPGRISRQVGHVMDIMPTVLEAAGIEYPESFEGRKLQKMDGVSLLPAILEEREFHRSFVQHYEKFDNVHDGYWKLIRQNSKKTTAPKSPWELYHLEKDRTQQNNVADLYPERVASMAAMYDDWSGEVKTILEGVYEKHPKFSKEYKMAEKIRKGKVKPHKMKKNKKKSKS
jgi:arylsulfatase